MEKRKIWNASRFCVSSLRRGHANLLCIVPILVYVPPRRYVGGVTPHTTPPLLHNHPLPPPSHHSLCPPSSHLIPPTQHSPPTPSHTACPRLPPATVRLHPPLLHSSSLLAHFSSMRVFASTHAPHSTRGMDWWVHAPTTRSIERLAHHFCPATRAAARMHRGAEQSKDMSATPRGVR